jgi:hypothetical protein
MNTPYLWFSPEDYSQKILGSYDHESCPNSSTYIQGKPIKGDARVPSFTFPVSRSRLVNYDVLPNTIGVPLISPRVASLLTEICPNDFQLIPARIQAHDVPIDDYSLLNVLVEISGMDHAQSSFILVPGTKFIMSIERLRYASGAIGDHHLARERDYSPFLWVSDHIVQRFARAKFKGYAFKPPEAIHR